MDRGSREKLAGHRGKVVWLTGLSGAGKSTIANATEQILYAQGFRTYILDGDNVRHGLTKDLGFSVADRIENIRRITEVAKLFLDSGIIVLASFISPFRAERDMARNLFDKGDFMEIFIDASLEVAESRDPKGLYKKARAGNLPNFTGIDSAYEEPENPDLVLRTDELSIADAVDKLVDSIKKDIDLQ